MSFKLIIYKSLYRAKGIITGLAKVFAVLTGAQVVILFMLAEMADAPLPWFELPTVRFAVFLAIFFLVPKVMDFFLLRVRHRG